MLPYRILSSIAPDLFPFLFSAPRIFKSHVTSFKNANVKFRNIERKQLFHFIITPFSVLLCSIGKIRVVLELGIMYGNITHNKVKHEEFDQKF
jgi:hypothetical protein